MKSRFSLIFIFCCLAGFTYGQITDTIGKQHFLDEVVISATKTDNTIRDIPARINLLTGYQIKAMPVQYPDEYLQFVPGVYVSRPFGIFSSKSTVTMRGLDGKEQGRVLVMLDGIPVNKADGGSVNWNLVATGDIERIEVVKGPGSSIYGGNAMGGSINVITRKPQKKISGYAGLEYGTYNTIGGRLQLAGRLNDSIGSGFYWGLNGRYLQSDGYITQSEADQAANPYIVKSNMKEWSGGIKLGYEWKKSRFIEIDLLTFDDRQGTGEVVFQDEGNTTDHDTYHFRGRYHGENEKSEWNASLFYFNEHYKRVNEFIKDDYTLYDVLSIRKDAGGMFNYSRKFSARHRLTAGLDAKQGSVDAKDIYYTSTDIVYNLGKINTVGIFAQDEFSFGDDKFKIIAALRYDYASYFDGAFFVETPTAETYFIMPYVDSSQTEFTWHALSPKLSARYSINADNRVYLSYARGFRPSVLDDLCRSGRIRGGFKIANPELEPEVLDNFEAGGDFLLPGRILLSTSAYFSMGKDFIYYVNSGDSIDMGFGPRPIYLPQNITGVNIFGLELELTYDILPGLRLVANYSHNHSEISAFKPGDNAGQPDLEGKFLVDVPADMANFSVYWMNRIINASLAAKYNGKRWVNDQNVFDEIVGDDRYPAYFTLDARLWKEYRKLAGSITVQNILDTKFYDSKGAVCPGRFITVEVGVKF
ncbi:MAG: TonB-dependent receptor [Bacteroidales bacterium]|nr:TonB-dependent receptor [Bacteroidales bacterium]